jgi:hypothetical protein
VRKNRHPRPRTRTDAVVVPLRPLPDGVAYGHRTSLGVPPNAAMSDPYDPAGYGYPGPVMYPPYVDPEPDPPPRRWPWIVFGVAGLAVVGVLCWLIARNAALFAVVTAITIIIVCGGGQEVARRRRDDW